MGNYVYEVPCYVRPQIFASLERTLNSTHVLIQPPDKAWGSRYQGRNGSWLWNGLVGQLERGEADVSVAGLTVTVERQSAIDFTVSVAQARQVNQAPAVYRTFSRLPI